MQQLQQDEQLNNHLIKNGVNTKMVFGHPVGLFVLFFTEMWERFSYYGMRALLTLFLISELANGGWAWSRESAMELYAWYTGLVYLTPLIGGFIADRLTGYRKAVIIGAVLMTLGHASMALEGTGSSFFYLGLLLIILGNGLFKPNISSIVGQLYPDNSAKKDSAYTIFYMGINAGAFLGMLLCGYIGEKIGWHYGFGLAGIFMFFGMLQFYYAQRIFGLLGNRQKDTPEADQIAETGVAGEQPAEKVSKRVVRDRLIVIVVLCLSSIFFWMAFEQAGGSMSIFAKDYTQRVLGGNAALTFKWVDAILTIFPLLIVTLVLFSLAKKIFAEYPISIFFTALSFAVIWCLGIWKVQREFNAVETEVAASWFQILNSFFIITLATPFSRMWERVFNPNGPVKFAIGLVLLGIGFAALAYGSRDIPQGAATAQVSMVWLVLAYFFHTSGELCISPVGLSYMSKLSPKSFAGFIFGLWFGCTAVANWLAGMSGSLIDRISEAYSLSTFFLIFAVIPGVAGLILVLFSPLLKRMMHGIH
ncbi:peptide MFS transporter [Parapedobacter sp. ISTM3]|uniref:peptide MFS transporter n=1 Tax=Parapedobacter sp. ISTM3 TaxID=2800130 RepID=UPI00190813FA|nr:peptide MFS transporter [Parapedobacter sp. ISTM3]MBK1439528.1 peptide MFS transporter [Parapedobacter sp. ISTM3]